MSSARKQVSVKPVRINLAQSEYEILEDIAESLNWRTSFSSKDTESDVYWQDTHLSTEELTSLKSFQRINHFPGMYSIARKDHLARNLKLMKSLFPKDYNFFPPTWILPKDHHDLRSQFNAKRAKTFIAKPEASSQGRGIFLTRRFEDIPEHCVVQRYLHKPFLLDGLKFDLRVYVLITACDPLRMFIHEEGLVRLATETYQPPVPGNLDDLYMHLTNYAINKNNPSYIFNTRSDADFVGHKRSLKKFMAYLETEGYDSKTLWSEISDLAVKTVCLVQPLLAHLYRASQANDPGNQICFQIIGIDVFLDYRLRPYLLEVNHTPSFATDTPLDYDIKFNVISDALKILALSPSNRANYYSNFQTYLLNRATKGIKEMRDYRTQVRKEMAQKRSQDEKMFMGGYTRVFPCEDQEKYETFMNAAKDLWQNNGNPKARSLSKVERNKVPGNLRETTKSKTAHTETQGKTASSKNVRDSNSHSEKTDLPQNRELNDSRRNIDGGKSSFCEEDDKQRTTTSKRSLDLTSAKNVLENRSLNSEPQTSKTSSEFTQNHEKQRSLEMTKNSELAKNSELPKYYEIHKSSDLNKISELIKNPNFPKYLEYAKNPCYSGHSDGKTYNDIKHNKDTGKINSASKEYAKFVIDNSEKTAAKKVTPTNTLTGKRQSPAFHKSNSARGIEVTEDSKDRKKTPVLVPRGNYVVPKVFLFGDFRQTDKNS